MAFEQKIEARSEQGIALARAIEKRGAFCVGLSLQGFLEKLLVAMAFVAHGRRRHRWHSLYHAPFARENDHQTSKETPR